MSSPQQSQPPQRRHPLEDRPAAPAGSARQPSQRVTLNIPSVTPQVTYILIAVNIIIFLVRAVSPTLDERIFLWGANHAPEVFLRGQYYRLFSAMFLHAGIYDSSGQYVLGLSVHLISNMYILYAVGASMERLFGHTRFLIIYLLGGLTGSILSALLGGDSVYSVGASGAVFAILGAEFVYLYRHRKLMGAAGQARRRSLLVFAAMNLFAGIASALPGSLIRIDNWGHIGGLIGGMILSWFICPMLNLRLHPERPNELLGEDTNPLNKSYWAVSLYLTALIIMLFIGVSLARR